MRPTRTLLILTLNDFHGQVDPIRLRSYETPRRILRIGGAEALVATVTSQRRQHGGRVLLLDAGDFMQGSAISNSFEGVPVRELYRRLGVDAVAVGNHEFDYGPVGPRSTGRGNPTGALEAWARGATFPVLSATVARKDGKPLGWKNVQPTVLIQRAGLRVGIIGLTTLDSPDTTHPANVKTLKFRPHAPRVIRGARDLRKRGAEVIVLLAHVGGKCTSRKASSCHGPIARLLRALPAGTVDAAISGHSHQCMWHRINGVPLVQACDRGRALGRIEVTVGGRPREVRARALAPLPVCHDVYSDSGGCEARMRTGTPRGKIVPNPLLAQFGGPVSEVRRMLAAYRVRIRPRPSTVIARAARAVPHPRQGESPMGTLLADVMLAAVPGAQVALVNAGGVRAPLSKGDITYADVYRVFPFDNQLAYADLTGRELRQVMNDYLSREHAGFMAVSGIRYRIRCGRPLRMTRLTDAKGQPILANRRYRVALSDFLLAGGVGFSRVLSKVDPSRKRLLKGKLIRDALVAHLKATRQPINSAARPILRANTPSIEVENGPCVRKQRKRKPRYICR